MHREFVVVFTSQGSLTRPGSCQGSICIFLSLSVSAQPKPENPTGKSLPSPDRTHFLVPTPSTVLRSTEAGILWNDESGIPLSGKAVMFSLVFQRAQFACVVFPLTATSDENGLPFVLGKTCFIYFVWYSSAHSCFACIVSQLTARNDESGICLVKHVFYVFVWYPNAHSLRQFA